MYYFYITTNPSKTVLYCGMTNHLERRLAEHYEKRGTRHSFAGKYHCYKLIYFEEYKEVKDAILREKEVKKWRREKKFKLISEMNPEWTFLNDVR